jgi:hypothetical protein
MWRTTLLHQENNNMILSAQNTGREEKAIITEQIVIIQESYG